MNCNTCKMCQSADKKLENFVASKSGEFETAFQRTIDQKVKRSEEHTSELQSH